jgi:hypothetical protein
LWEAMVNKNAVILKSEIKKIEATKDFSAGTWRQLLQISRVGSTEYLDEGNGRFEMKR